MMLGKDVTSQFPEIENTMKNDTVLEIQNMTDITEKVKDISMTIKKGEVVGIYGLLGSGRTEILETIYGLRSLKSGKIILKGKECAHNKSSKDMVKNGVFLIPEDRRYLSIFRDFFTIRENLSIGYLDKISNKIGLINSKKEHELFKDITSRPELRVKYTRENQDIEELSGGNQQKIVLGRWIYRDNLELLLLDEPTHGIDVGVKYDIYVLIRKIAAQGKAILMISSELPELTGVCDRLYVIKNGQMIGEMNRNDFSNEVVLEMVL
jgi:methyl-galactoside transport system ATP-binding protein